MRELVKIFLGFVSRCYTYWLTSRKISGILVHLKQQQKLIEPSKNELILHSQLWNSFPQSRNFKWLAVYQSISGVLSLRYVAENIYYSEIEPRLNVKFFSKAFTDKNFYHKTFRSEILPKVIVRNIDGVFYTGDYQPLGLSSVAQHIKQYIGQKLIIKPTHDSGSGSGVRVVNIMKSSVDVTPVIRAVNDLSSLLAVYGSNFLIQEFVNQHPFYRQFNESSLNTVRIFTYRSVVDEEINIIHSVLRMGFKDSVVDNQAAGGLACGIDDRGKLRSFGVDKKGNKYLEHNGVVLEGVGPVYKLDAIHLMAKEVAQNMYYSRLLGLDFCVDIDGDVKLIEVNDINNEINFYQMTNGPLFGAFTEEIITFCHTKPKSFIIDFTI